MLKEAFKTLCEVNQWSYAIFWKIDCLNPKLLIWDEYYYEAATCSELPGKENADAALHDCNASWISAEAGDKVHFLVNKMMMDSRVNIVGEGLVGRVAFTGNHEWILSENYCGDSHPPEVVKEVCRQFSAGMKTVAVVPVLPHGIVQLGSSVAMMENYGFISDVISLILQLAYVSAAVYSASQENIESGIIPSDHLLEAVVSKDRPCSEQSMGDNVSYRTTLTNMSSASTPNSSLPYGQFWVSDQLKGELFGAPKYLAKAGTMSSCSFRNGSSKEESRSYLQGSSVFRSRISSWMEKDQKPKPSNIVYTRYSKNPDETGKTNRKPRKPGESLRPRPKDRQMIEDRVKELRKIVPNGAKCSIDALLERTLKQMLFLQSVTKHADKLKQTEESKIFCKDEGLLLKDNFEGGATWAYEVGSQSMVSQIIVEDLNQPRQMLVEMLCEKRGLFLEIADIIRGLGLTILKGVMETRNENIWARFAVEANRDMTRMEILISLLRLLEQSPTGANAAQFP